MKHSLIQHPPGSKFARIDFWVLEVLGEKEHAAAACLGQLEYWQRLQLDLMEKKESDGWVRRSAADFSAVLHGLFGEDKVRAGLRLLVKIGWVEEGDETVLVGQLWRTRKKYRLVVAKVNEAAMRFFSEKSKQTDFSGSGEPENQATEAEKSAHRGRKIGSNTILGSSISITTTTPPPACGGSGDEETQTPALQGLEIASCLVPHLPSLNIPADLPYEIRQQLLDELAGAIQAGGVKRAAAYFRALVQRARDGDFHPDLARQVAAERSRRAANAAVVATARCCQPRDRKAGYGHPIAPSRRKRQRLGCRSRHSLEALTTSSLPEIADLDSTS